MDYNYKIYTPSEYSKEISKISLSRYFENNSKESIEDIRIIDISCGTGNLLLEILENLIILSKEIYGEYRYRNNWITGIDIDGNALEIFKLRWENLILKYNLIGELNIIEGNSIYEKIDGHLIFLQFALFS